MIQPLAFAMASMRMVLNSGSNHNVECLEVALQGFKTILIVAHRLSTVQHCDRVYKIEDATIVGEGTLEELTKSAS
jgi:ABC-type multidrug transport system fused ATPase/permease subunit